MKKLILSIAIIMIATVTFAQVKVRPGVRLGLNSSSISNVEQADRKLGLSAASFVNIQFSRFYALQVEGTYNNQGISQNNRIIYYDYYGNPVIEPGSSDLNIHYVGIGIANKFFIIPGVGFHFIIGPSIEVNVEDDGADITPVDFSLFGGIGYEFPFGLGIEARYKQGLIDVRDDYDGSYYIGNDYYYAESDGDYYDGNNLLNGVIQLGVYYKFSW